MKKTFILFSFLSLIIALTACGQKPKEVAAPSPTPVTKETVLNINDSPFVYLLPTNLARTLIIKSKNLGEFTEGDYELLYQAKEGERGIIGKLSAVNQTFSKSGLDLGSRSRGTFRPDSQVTGGKLTIRFHDNNRSKIISEFAIYGQVKPDKLVLPTSQASLTLAKPPRGEFIMIDTSGLPVGLNGYTPVSRPIGIYPETVKFTDATLSLPANSQGAGAELVVLTTTSSGDKWVKVEGVKRNNTVVSFPLKTGGTYLVVAKT